MASISPVDLTINIGAGTFTADLSTLAGSTEHEITSINQEKKLVIYAKNTSAQKAITFLASDTFCNKGQGDTTFTLPQNIPMAIQLEGAKHINSDGTIEFTVAASMTGELSVFELPK